MSVEENKAMFRRTYELKVWRAFALARPQQCFVGVGPRKLGQRQTWHSAPSCSGSERNLRWCSNHAGEESMNCVGALGAICCSL
jgi:hypothetical protein